MSSDNGCGCSAGSETGKQAKSGKDHKKYTNKHKTAEDRKLDGPNRPAE